MLDLTSLEAPVFGDKESGLRFVTEALKLYETAQANYSGKAENKTSAKVTEVLEKVQNEDKDAVEMAEAIIANLRESIIEAMNLNPNVAVVLFPELEETKKVVGSWRDEATVTVDVVNDDDEEDRDLVAEYEALKNARTMIEGTFMAWQLEVGKLPASFVAVKKERINGKNVPTGEMFLKFPGKLVSPSTEGNTKAGREPVSFQWNWTLVNDSGEMTLGKNLSITRLARLCSTGDGLLSFSDLKERFENRKWSDKDVNIIEVPTPRGKLIGERITK